MKLEKLNDTEWLAVDKDGVKWICKRKPFSNELGKWFVKLNVNENYEDVMRRISDNELFFEKTIGMIK